MKVLLYIFIFNIIYNIIHILFTMKKYKIYNQFSNDENNILLKKIENQLKYIILYKRPILIKLECYPSCGKSTFIKKYKNNYPNCIFYDIDDYIGVNHEKELLLNTKYPDKINILFGTISKTKYNDIIYISIFPDSQLLLFRNIIKRKNIFLLIPEFISLPKIIKWKESNKLLKTRYELYQLNFDIYKTSNKQIQYISNDFKTAIDFIIQTVDRITNTHSH